MYVGQTLKATFKTKEDNGTLTDAVSVSIKFYNPVGILVGDYSLGSGTVTRIAIGTYTASHVVNKPGVWSVDAVASIGGRETNSTADQYVEEI